MTMVQARQREAIVTAAVAALLLACLLGTGGFDLFIFGVGTDPAPSVAVTGASQTALVVTLACLIPKADEQGIRTIAFGAAFLGVVSAVVGFVVDGLFSSDPYALLWGVITTRGMLGICQGVVQVSLTVLAALLFASLAPRTSLLSVCLGFVVGFALGLAAQHAGAQGNFSIGIMTSVGVAAGCCAPFLLVRNRTPRVSAGPQHEKRLFGSFVTLVLCTVALSYLIGIFEGAQRIFDTTTGTMPWAGQTLLVCMVLAMFAYAWAIGIPVREDVIVIAASTMVATAYCLAATGHAGIRVGGVLCALGFTLLDLMLWIGLASSLRQCPERLYPCIALLIIATVAMQPLGSASCELIFSASSRAAAMRVIALLSIIIAGLCDLAAIRACSRKRAYVPDGPLEPDGNEEESKPIPHDVTKVIEHQGQEEPCGADSLDEICAYYGLSRREREVLDAVIDGYTLASASKKLGLSDNTVRTYMRRVYIKMGVNDRHELIALLGEYNL